MGGGISVSPRRWGSTRNVWIYFIATASSCSQEKEVERELGKPSEKNGDRVGSDGFGVSWSTVPERSFMWTPAVSEDCRPSCPKKETLSGAPCAMFLRVRRTPRRGLVYEVQGLERTFTRIRLARVELP